MFIKILVFIIMFAVGLVIMKYNEPLVRTFGKSYYAEKYLGMGGTYTMWKLIGIAIILVGFAYMLGLIEFGNWNTNIDETKTGEKIEYTQ